MNAKQARLLLAGLLTPGEWGGSNGEPVAWLYGPVRATKIPVVDGYEFVTIASVSTITNLTVTLTFRKTWKQDVQGGNIPQDALWTQVGDIVYTFKKTGYNPSLQGVTISDWGEATVCSEATWTDVRNVRWTNHNIVSQGSIAHEPGELILVASDPIPVYE